MSDKRPSVLKNWRERLQENWKNIPGTLSDRVFVPLPKSRDEWDDLFLREMGLPKGKRPKMCSGG